MVHLYCSNCGRHGEKQSATEFIHEKWGRMGDASYCPECAARDPKINTDPLYVAMGVLDSLSYTIATLQKYIDDFHRL